ENINKRYRNIIQGKNQIEKPSPGGKCYLGAQKAERFCRGLPCANGYGMIKAIKERRGKDENHFLLNTLAQTQDRTIACFVVPAARKQFHLFCTLRGTGMLLHALAALNGCGNKLSCNHFNWGRGKQSNGTN
ncbi:MAG: hypothetical protein PHO41_11625, partial [Eubacteriales bacterium]|nr:hypothetical protein [Eubacteriales bacterium]